MTDIISSAIEAGVKVAGAAKTGVEVAKTAGTVAKAGGEVAQAASVVAEAGGDVAQTAKSVIEAGKVAEVVEGAGKTVDVARVAEAAPTRAAAEKVRGLAETAEKATDPAAAEQAVRQLAELPDEVGVKPNSTAIDSGKLTLEQDNAVSQQTETNLSKWDQENPTPDPSTNPEEYKKWCEKRDQHEIDYIAKTKGELDMKQWDQENPEPDKQVDAKKHEEWEKKRSKFDEKSKERRKDEAKKQKEDERGSILEKINRLKQLYSERMDINEAIKILRRKPIKTNEDKVNLAKFQVRYSELSGEIKILETDLMSQAKRGGPIVALMITTALAGMIIYKIGQNEGAL